MAKDYEQETKSSFQPDLPRQKSYTEQDIQDLLSEPKFVVAVDAYGAGCCNLQQMLHLAWDKPPYIPKNLDLLIFARLVHEVVRRIHTGLIKVPDEDKSTYHDFYSQQDISPDE